MEEKVITETKPSEVGQTKASSCWDRAIGLLERASKQHHVLALRDGMISSIPIILVGSTFLLLGAQGPVLQDYFAGQVSWLPDLCNSSWVKWYLANTQLVYLPYRLTMGLLALYIAFTIAAALAVQYKLPPIPQGLGAVAALLCTGVPVRVALTESSKPEWAIALKPLGPEGIFLAIILGILMVEISRLLLKPDQPKPESTNSSNVPPSVVAAFNSFLPMLILVSAVWAIRHCLGFDIHSGILALMSPLQKLGDTLWAVLASNFFLHLFAVAGVHGVSVVNAVMLPLWQQYVAANAEAHSLGLPLPHVTAYPFYQWFIWIGGAGATFPAVFIALFSRDAHLKKVGKISLIPAFFNVNEPFLFGIPVVANPLLAIPCIVAPLISSLVAWFAVSGGWVSPPFIEVPWVMPCFLGAILSTQDPRSLVLLAVNFVLSGLVWYPFLHFYSQRRAAEASENTESNQV